jgi:hypothetical protein
MTDMTQSAPTSETFFQHVKDFFVGAETDAVDVIDGLASKFDADVWPSVKTFIETLASQVGQTALKSAIASAPLLVSGGFGAAAASVGAAVVATATLDAPIDAEAALQATQAALQVVKVANATVTAGDAPTVAAIAAAVPQAPAV